MTGLTTAVLASTVNFHINYTCNADCVFCYRPSGAELPLEQQLELISLLAPTTNRINFAGGEPTLVKHLPQLLAHAKAQGLQTSLITNASAYLANPKKLLQVLPHLDMIGVSIDSIDEETNKKIGRPHFSAEQWFGFSRTVKAHGVSLKINTAVCRYNLHENLFGFIAEMNPDRFKVFQTFAVAGTEGATKHSPKDWAIDNTEFALFVMRHESVNPVVENAEAMRGSYAMVSPDGCFYDSTQGHYTKSDPILEVGVEEAFRQVSFSQEKFEARGGLFSIPVVSR